MARLIVHVEGQTEENFVNAILLPHLTIRGYSQVSARLLGNPRQRQRRGGIRPWMSARNDIVRHLAEDRNCFATMMVDYYGLPSTGNSAWPGRAAASSRIGAAEKAECIATALLQDVVEQMGPKFDARRFLPFVVMHEFEGLLFSDCSAFSRGLGQPSIEQRLRERRNQFTSPEEINDSPNSAPSLQTRAISSSGVPEAIAGGEGRTGNRHVRNSGAVSEFQSLVKAPGINRRLAIHSSISRVKVLNYRWCRGEMSTDGLLIVWTHDAAPFGPVNKFTTRL